MKTRTPQNPTASPCAKTPLAQNRFYLSWLKLARAARTKTSCVHVLQLCSVKKSNEVITLGNLKIPTNRKRQPDGSRNRRRKRRLPVALFTKNGLLQFRRGQFVRRDVVKKCVVLDRLSDDVIYDGHKITWQGRLLVRGQASPARQRYLRRGRLLMRHEG